MRPEIERPYETLDYAYKALDIEKTFSNAMKRLSSQVADDHPVDIYWSNEPGEKFYYPVEYDVENPPLLVTDPDDLVLKDTKERVEGVYFERWIGNSISVIITEDNNIVPGDDVTPISQSYWLWGEWVNASLCAPCMREFVAIGIEDSYADLILPAYVYSSDVSFKRLAEEVGNGLDDKPYTVVARPTWITVEWLKGARNGSPFLVLNTESGQNRRVPVDPGPFCLNFKLLTSPPSLCAACEDKKKYREMFSHLL